jgi:hypothetical protein
MHLESCGQFTCMGKEGGCSNKCFHSRHKPMKCVYINAHMTPSSHPLRNDQVKNKSPSESHDKNPSDKAW